MKFRLSQLFFIQPAVRVIFKAVFAKDIKAREKEYNESKKEGNALNPTDETEAIADIFRRIDEIQAELAHEHRRRKALEASINASVDSGDAIATRQNE